MGFLLPLAFIWLVNQFQRPLAFAAVYAGIGTLLALVTGGEVADALLGGGVTLVYFALFFSLLVRFTGSVAIWICVLVGGLLLWFGAPLFFTGGEP